MDQQIRLTQFKQRGYRVPAVNVCRSRSYIRGTPPTFLGRSRRNKGCWVPAQTYLDNASSYLRHARTRGAEHAESVLALLPGRAQIIHPSFVLPVAVKIVRDDRMTRPGFQLGRNIDRLRWV